MPGAAGTWFPPLGELQAGLDGAACLGPWTFDPGSAQLAVAPPLADRLNLAPTANAVAIESVLISIHPTDRMRVENALYAASGIQSLFEAEFRIGDGAGLAWVRLMGRADRTNQDRVVEDCSLLVRGLAFDLTESRVRAGTPAQRAQLQANQLADHVIAMQSLVAGLHNPFLAERLEQFEKALGVEIARRLLSARLRSIH